jgi:hypothetical protein
MTKHGGFDRVIELNDLMKFLPLFAAIFWLGCNEPANTENATEVGIDSPAEVEQASADEPDSYDATFADGLTEKVFHNYLQLRTALVESDPAGAARAAGNMAETLEADYGESARLARSIADSDDLTVQRRHFAELTEAVGPLLTEGVTGGTIYRQHCPMAFDGEGADWFSDAEAIRNPYYGDKMLTCGRIEEKISK